MKMKLFIVLLIACGLSTVSTQIHAGTVQCYDCDDRHVAYPQCLTQSLECKYGQFCRVRYNTRHIKWTLMECSHRHQGTIQQVDRKCPYGGVFNPISGLCGVLCQDSACVQNIIAELKFYHSDEHRTFCPRRCETNNLDHCLDNAGICDQYHFCNIKIRHGRLQGACDPLSKFEVCLQSKLSCVGQSGMSIEMAANKAGSDGTCTLECCTDNTCIHNHFPNLLINGIGTYTNASIIKPTTQKTTISTLPSRSQSKTSIASSSIPLTTLTTKLATSPSTTSTSTTTTLASTATRTRTTTTTNPFQLSTPFNISEHIKTNCKDQLEKGMCQALVQQKSLCQDPMNQKLCSETCGICKAIKDANCHDTVINNGCEVLKNTTNVCQNSMAMYTCPQTCGLCDLVIEDILKKFQTGQLTPPALTSIQS